MQKNGRTKKDRPATIIVSTEWQTGGIECRSN